jgi:glycerol-3-phosphate dehydrogenase
MYDILAGKENMESSYLMSKGKALETFPMLKSDGLVGALVYYDGGVPLGIYVHVLSLCWG